MRTAPLFVVLALTLASVLVVTPTTATHDDGPESWDFNTSGQGWTGGTGILTAWTRGTDDGEDSWITTIDGEKGYGSNEVVDLTSPELDMTGKIPDRLTFKLNGAAEIFDGDCIDFLEVLAGPVGGPFVVLDSYCEPQEWGDGPIEIDFADQDYESVVDAVGNATMQIVFSLVTDLACDALVSEPSGELCGEGAVGFAVDDVVLSFLHFVPPESPEPPNHNPGSGGEPPVFNSFGLSPGTLDITGDAAGITFTAEVGDDRDVLFTEVFLLNADTFEHFRFQLKFAGMAADGIHEVWSGTLPRTDGRLTTGTWLIAGVAYDDEGGIGVEGVDAQGALTIYSAEVEAGEVAGPVVRLIQSGQSVACASADDQIVHGSSVLRFDLTTNILARATYHLVFPHGTVSPEFRLESPFILTSGSLEPGPQDVVVRLYDRDHSVGECTVSVIKDTGAPGLEVVLSNETYAGVPFDISVFTRDQSTHNVTLTIGDQVLRGADLEGPGGESIFEVTLESAGGRGYSVQATDVLGQSTVVTGQILVDAAFTDVVLSDARVLDRFALAGEEVRFAANVSQGTSIVPMPVLVTFDSGSTHSEETVELPLEGEVGVSFAGSFRSGPHTLMIAANAPMAVNETDDSNQNATLEFEVYLGKTVFGDAEYFIRASGQGHPVEAVARDGTTYALTLDQNATTLYTFTVEDDGLYWDPLQRDAQGRAVTVIEPQADGGDSNGTPGPHALMVIVLLAGLAFAFRRRR